MGNFDTEETDAVMSSIFEEKKDAKEEMKKLLQQLDPAEIEQLLVEIKNSKKQNESDKT
jgi:hypothetical protein